MRILFAIALLTLAGCAAPTAAITAGGSQVELRQIQTREYDTLDKRGTLRSVIATLQDLGFVIDDGNAELGLVSGTRLSGRIVQIMVTVRQGDGNQILVRASIQASGMTGFEVVTEPETYQQFFAALSKSLFLEAHKIQ